MPANDPLLPTPLYGERVIATGETVDGIGRVVTGIVLDPRAGPRWWIALAGACGLLCVFAASRVPVGLDDGTPSAVSALDRASYDGWVGIAHGWLLLC